MYSKQYNRRFPLTRLLAVPACALPIACWSQQDPAIADIRGLEAEFSQTSASDFLLLHTTDQIPRGALDALAAHSITGTLAEWGESFSRTDVLSSNVPNLRHVISWQSERIIVVVYQDGSQSHLFLANEGSDFGCHYRLGGDISAITLDLMQGMFRTNRDDVRGLACQAVKLH